MTLGIVRRGVVRLVPHCPSWSEDFVRERARLVAAMGDRVLAIEHVGSTAIPGIYAKPVLDMAVALADLDQASAMQPAMRQIGYDFPGDIGIVGERLFGRGPEILTHLAHVVQADGAKWAEYLEFRDALRADPGLARKYDQLKRELAQQFPEERGRYTEAKGLFIQSVLRRSGKVTSETFVRLQATYRGRLGVEVGIFVAVDHLRRADRLTSEEEELYFDIDDWFKAELPNPSFYADGNTAQAITWFKKSSSVEMLERLEPLCLILDKYGVSWVAAESTDPGTVIYEDQFQVGVIPYERFEPSPMPRGVVLGPTTAGAKRHLGKKAQSPPR